MEATGGVLRMAVVVKVFILGLPGSGKSAIARFVSAYVHDYRWAEHSVNDYNILDDIFRQDIARERFKPAELGGFDVLKFEVFDEALQLLEQKVIEDIDALTNDANKLFLIEFSRNNYRHAFQQFNRAFLRDAYFLYLDTDVKLCKERIRDRVANPQFEQDDFNVSDYIFETYYNGDDGADLIAILAEHGVDKAHVRTMKNHDSYEKACMTVEPYIKIILDSATQEGLDKREKSSEESVPNNCVEGEDQERTSGKEQAVINEEVYARVGS
jgi:adenylate kinase family enzyme